MAEFKIGDVVMHNREGLSTILSITSMAEKEFFLLQVSRSKDQTIYVPVSSASNIIRDIMDENTANCLLDSLKNIVKEFNSNTKQRRDSFKKRLSSGSVNDMAYLFKQYELYKAFPEDVKLGPADVDMLQYASNYLLDELAIVYNVDRNSIREHILPRIM